MYVNIALITPDHVRWHDFVGQSSVHAVTLTLKKFRPLVKMQRPYLGGNGAKPREPSDTPEN